MTQYRLLEDIRYIGSQRKRSEKEMFMLSGIIQAEKSFRQKNSRDTNPEELKILINQVENAWRRKKYAEQKAKRKVSGSSPSHPINSMAAAAM
jgi:hypothetical protein